MNSALFYEVNIIRFKKEKRKSQGLRFTFLMNGICVTMSRYVYKIKITVLLRIHKPVVVNSVWLDYPNIPLLTAVNFLQI